MIASSTSTGPEAHKKNLTALLRDNARRYRLHEVFADFCEMGALSISNSVDPMQFEAREARYLQIMRRYEPKEVQRFPRMLAELVNWLGCGFADCMGDLFMSLEMGDHWKGQYFTPYPIAELMANITMGDVAVKVREQGFITVSEPACGAGGMLIAAAETMQHQGINYQKAMHATAVDVDATAVYMTYLQLSLLHVPAIVVHGNSLSLKQWGHWVTPAHVWGRWDQKLKGGALRESVLAPVPVENGQAGAEEAMQPEPTKEPINAMRRTVVDARIEQLSLFG